MAEKKNNNLWYIIGGIIIVLLVVLIIISLNKNSSGNNIPATPTCQGVYILYQGNCCIDSNYNNICDQLESQQPKDNGVVLNAACSAFQPCAVDSWDYLGDGEICNQGCQNGQCVLTNCKVGGCGRGTGVNCRAGSTCDGLTNKCVVLG